ERQIHALERRIAEIGAMLTNPRLYVDGDRVRAVSRERKEAEERMSGLLREWEDLATALAGHEGVLGAGRSRRAQARARARAGAAREPVVEAPDLHRRVLLLHEAGGASGVDHGSSRAA